MIDLKYTLIGLAVAIIVGALAHYFYGFGFWSSTVIAALALLANGLLALWEDRGKFND